MCDAEISVMCVNVLDGMAWHGSDDSNSTARMLVHRSQHARYLQTIVQLLCVCAIFDLRTHAHVNGLIAYPN